jgi:hypothetical protein
LIDAMIWRNSSSDIHGAVHKPVVEACGLAAQILSPNGGAQLAVRRGGGSPASSEIFVGLHQLAFETR